MGSIPDFYVYILLRPNGRPFYVGKGSGDRVNAHEMEAKRGCECHKCRVIRKVWKSGHQITKSIIFTSHIEAEVLQCEARLIDTIGLGLLTNCVPGTYPMTGKVIKSVREDGWNALEHRYWLMTIKDKHINLKMHEFLEGQYTRLQKLKRYEPDLTPIDHQRIDQAIEAHKIALWPKLVTQHSFLDDLSTSYTV